MEIREIFSVLRAGWWWLLLGVLVGGGASLVVSLAQTPLYAAHTQLFVSTTDSGSTAEVFQGSQFSQERVTSYERLLAGEELANRVIERLNLSYTPSELTGRITATAIADTVLLDVTVTDASAQRAEKIAGIIGEEFPSLVMELETPEGVDRSPVKVTVTDRPEVPSEPNSPLLYRNLALGLSVGLLVGAACLILRAQLDRSVKDPDDAAVLAGAPVIGTVLRDAALEKQHVVVRSGASRTAEDYRQLRTNLQFLNVDQPPKVIMISSALPSEGKTTVVVNLALALADAGRKVIIIEADLRRPKVTRYLGMVGGVGLTNILAGTADVGEVLQKYGSGDLSVIAAGPTPPNPGELLASSQMASLVGKLREVNDYVLVDAPPLLPVADSSGLAVMMDGVLLSVRYGSTTKGQLGQAATTLNRVGAKTLGVILNIVPPKADLASAYGYGYSYEANTER
jgi:capsular exopolysaccharide synthesis family protein